MQSSNIYDLDSDDGTVGIALNFLLMALNDYRDLECEANGMTTPAEKAQLRTEVERISVTERMADFWRDYEAWQNPWVISPYTIINTFK